MTPVSLTPEFPRTYGLSPFSKIYWRVMGCGAAAMGLFPIYAIHSPSMQKSGPHGATVAIAIGLLVVLLGLLTFRGASRMSVVLTSDAIKSIGFCSHRTMRFGEIRGKRREAGGGISRTILLPKDKKRGKIIIKDGAGFVYDDSYKNWLATIPDLDAIDREQRRKDGKLRWYET